MTTELCPFCGAGLEEFCTYEQPPVTSDGRVRLSVACRSCGARGPGRAGAEEQAWEAWDRRPEVERLRADVNHWKAVAARTGGAMEVAANERDRLRAVLAETPEVLEACERAWCEDVTEHQDFAMQGRARDKRMERYRRVLAALRARAGVVCETCGQENNNYCSSAFHIRAGAEKP